MIFENRFVANTLNGDEEGEDTPQPNTTIEEPKLLGFNSNSNEKVCLTLALLYVLMDSCNLTCLNY